ncbi:hypothetical protein M2451_001214 [Dysgonomonas sp. PFB1-18]|nr:hypothetical protein [Dysgonomonas sp. PF1-14]MDH6338400.1 hypothetical protein [Dysgonomonas sp. PF1-16]MDH6379897.1 hypothetical protein [Dysgonomonas sp. PFB1-18]MDH6397013.1 hypothetical protein [Dysgonomonas sp. PF1-23]
MSDWNTLHLFDDRSFFSDIVPDLQNEGTLVLPINIFRFP